MPERKDNDWNFPRLNKLTTLHIHEPRDSQAG